jgi:hypothetical protein
VSWRGRKEVIGKRKRERESGELEREWVVRERRVREREES